MKPIELHLQAFGQYLEPQTVRFDKLDPVFLITGETGAGKTTLFDAISYALYGRGLGARQSAAGLRSQLAGEETSTLVRFLLSVRGEQWQVERSPYQFVRRKRTGAAEIDTYATLKRLSGPGAPQVIAVGEVQDKIRSVVGLRYEDFSKILVLPQGEFQQFLAMKSADRATLLKTLFPVSQHEALARMAKEAVREIKAAVDTLEAVIRELLMDFNAARFPEDEAALKAELEALLETEKAAQVQAKDTQDALYLARTLAKQIADLRGRQQEKLDHETTRPLQDARLAEQQAAQRAAAALPVVMRAATLAAELATLQEQLANAIANEETAAKLAAELQPQWSALADRRTALQQAVIEAERLARRLADLAQLKDAVVLQTGLAGDVKSRTDELAKAFGQWEIAKAKVAELEMLQTQRDTDRPALDAADAAVRTCRLLEQDASAIQLWVARLDREAQDRCAQEREKLSEFDQLVDGADKTVHAVQQRLQANAALVVAATLQDGAPCPACGSLDHPHPHQGHPEDGDLVALLRQAEQTLKSARDAFAAQDKLVTQLETAHQMQKATVEQAQTRLQVAGYADPAAWKQALQQAEVALQVQRDRDTALVNRLAQRPAALDAVTRLGGIHDQAQAALQTAATRLAAGHATVQAIRDRVGISMDLDADLAAGRLEHDAAAVRNRAEEAGIAQVQARWQTLERELAGATATLEAATAARDEKQAVLPVAQQAAADALAQADFALPEDAQAAARSPSQLAALQTQVLGWQGRHTFLVDTIAALDLAIVGREEPDVGALEQRATAAATAAQKATEDRLGKYNQLDLLQKKAEQLERKQAEVARTIADSQGMLTLSQHLNGERAPKIDFPTWMLTWWLEKVLHKANRRMSAMSDGRFTFALRTTVKDGRSCAGLDVDVLDTWSNQRRDVNALSGGEKFLASLSLALGLADVVQGLNGGVQLDTLFIDEGFGGLDLVTLERAMGMVYAIAENRAVGLISHVEVMKTDIPSQIRVEKSPKGSTARVVGARMV